MNIQLLDWDNATQTVIDLVNAKHEHWLACLDGSPIVLLRDWKGRIHICLPGESTGDQSSKLQGELLSIHNALGALSAAATSVADGNAAESATQLALFKDELFDPSSIWNSSDKIALQQSPVPIYLIDRQDKESDWLRPQLADTSQGTPRAVFFGVKGGVGRSTALVGLAVSLGRIGKKVLIVDTDFESPGVSSSLLSAEVRPEYGLVDWFAAEMLDPNTADRLLDIGSMVEASPLNKLISGRILVAPTFGSKTQAYVSKLGRLYSTNEASGTYAERLNRVISQLEAEHTPDVTLIDSRAGIDDTSAVAITRLGARALLFAANTTQTWDAYKLLFRHLQRNPSIHTPQDFRKDIQMVSALTPDPAIAKGYYESMRESAYELFQTLYDEIAPGEDGLAAFNFDFDDHDAPHNLWRIRWDDALRAFDPTRNDEHMGITLQAKVFGEFTTNANKWLLGIQE